MDAITTPKPLDPKLFVIQRADGACLMDWDNNAGPVWDMLVVRWRTFLTREDAYQYARKYLTGGNVVTVSEALKGPKYTWTLVRAVKEIAKWQPAADKVGFYLTLAGGVLNKGYSDHDLDLVAVQRAECPDTTGWNLQVVLERIFNCKAATKVLNGRLHLRFDEHAVECLVVENQRLDHVSPVPVAVIEEPYPGYHVAKIEPGVYGEVSKISEETEELLDAYAQGNKVMVLNELSDILGAINGFIHNKYPGIELTDLLVMMDATARAFKSKKK